MTITVWLFGSLDGFQELLVGFTVLLQLQYLYILLPRLSSLNTWKKCQEVREIIKYPL